MGIRPLSDDLQKIALKELNEDPSRIEADIEHIKNWLKKQPHLISRTDDEWIVTFLRGCKFSLERTKEKLDIFYTMRTALPEFFTNRDPKAKEIREVMDSGIFLTLPGTDAKGRRITAVRPGKTDPGKIKIENCFKTNFMILDIFLQEDPAPIVCGTVNIIDLKDTSVAHALQMTPSLIKKVSLTFQEGYPFRPQAIHYINVPSFFETVLNLFKSFLKEKLKKRIHFHNNLESLHKHIPKSVLPTEYGGDAGSSQAMLDDWTKKLESYSSYFQDDDKYRSDESKRPGKPKTREDLFGLEGSFRQLNVD